MMCGISWSEHNSMYPNWLHVYVVLKQTRKTKQWIVRFCKIRTEVDLINFFMNKENDRAQYNNSPKLREDNM